MSQSIVSQIILTVKRLDNIAYSYSLYIGLIGVNTGFG